MLFPTCSLLIIHLLARDTYAVPPVGRAGSAGVLIGNKIFVQGGFTAVNATSGYGYATNEMIVLPVDTSYPLSSPAYEADSPLTNGSPTLLGQVSIFGGYNNSGLYMFGGQIDDASTVSKLESDVLYMFNTTTYNWTTMETIAGSWPAARDSFTGVAHVNSYGFIFGGEPLVDGSTWLFNTTWRLQPNNIWTEIGGVAPLGGRQSHGAAMLSDGRMVILGGVDHLDNNFALTTVLIFDTYAQQYTTQNITLSGTNPVARCSHAMVSTYDDKIIIHGGDDGKGNPYLNDLAVLDMKQSSLAWTVPATSGIAPSGRNAHIGLMVGTQMFIMYGQTGPDSVDNGVYVIDTNTWAWQTTYTPNDLQYTNTGVLSPSGANISSTQNNNTESNGESSVSSKAPSGAIIGGSVAGAAVALILAAIAIAAYIRRRKRKAEAETPIVYQFSEPPTDNKTLGNNIYNGVPPYYQQFTPAGNVSATDSSTAVNSWGDNSSYRMSVMSQKPNANIQAIYQKPDAED